MKFFDGLNFLIFYVLIWQIKLNKSLSYKSFSWGAISKNYNFNHGRQGDIKDEGNVLDGTFLTFYDPFGKKPT